MILAHFQETWPRRQLEWLLAGIITLLGVVYTLSPGLFERPYYAAMRGLMPQEWWALVCVLVGGVRLAFLFINGTMLPLSPAVRAATSGASCMVWAGLTIAAILNAYAPQVLAVWPLLLMFEVMTVMKTAREWGAATRVKHFGAANAAG